MSFHRTYGIIHVPVLSSPHPNQKSDYCNDIRNEIKSAEMAAMIANLERRIATISVRASYSFELENENARLKKQIATLECNNAQLTARITELEKSLSATHEYIKNVEMIIM